MTRDDKAGYVAVIGAVILFFGGLAAVGWGVNWIIVFSSAVGMAAILAAIVYRIKTNKWW